MKPLTIFFALSLLCGANAVNASNDAALNQAVKSLNARAQTDAGRKLVISAISQQTSVPEKTLQAHMTATHLNYGELLIAESLAQGSGKDLNAVIALKQGKCWADLSKEIKIDPNSLVKRLQNAEKTAQAGPANTKQAGNMKKPASSNQTDQLQSKPMGY